MRSFYKTYPTLPKNNLNWSHYRNLVTVKDGEKRKLLEDLALTEQLGAKDLQRAITQSKPRARPEKILKKLKATRGKLFTYTTTKEGEIDLGFNILLEKNYATSKQVQTDSSQAFTLNPSKSSYTYKAELERVVDGDTIHVKLDLGFGIKHREILRLAKINAAEAETKEGKKATAALKKILKDSSFLIVRTNKTDIYGRYVADIFFGKDNPKKVAENGEYLNQLLLDRGLVEVY
jgi:endonuclease YncB( thermonuclease family)